MTTDALARSIVLSSGLGERYSRETPLSLDECVEEIARLIGVAVGRMDGKVLVVARGNERSGNGSNGRLGSGADGDRNGLLSESLTDLVENYSLIVEKALVVPGSVYLGDAVEKASGRQVTRTSSSQTATRGGAIGSRKSGGSKDFIRDQAMFAFKTKLDSKIRKLNREVRSMLARGPLGVPVDTRRCTVCKRYGEETWLFCPADGKRMESV